MTGEYCFADFVVDLDARELRRGADAIALSPKAYQLLQILVSERPKALSKLDLQERLWPDTFVDVDHNLNTAINKIREVLGDSAESPRFVETLSRRGYRFIAPVTERIGSIPLALDITTRNRLVGRGPELNELHDTLQHATSGRRQIVFITGEVGIGKTALVDEFTREVAATALSLR